MGRRRSGGAKGKGKNLVFEKEKLSGGSCAGEKGQKKKAPDKPNREDRESQRSGSIVSPVGKKFWDEFVSKEEGGGRGGGPKRIGGKEGGGGTQIMREG